MTTHSTLELAEKLIGCLDARTSQGSVGSQAQDCAPIVYRLGYQELSGVLNAISSGMRVTVHPNGRVVIG